MTSPNIHSISGQERDIITADFVNSSRMRPNVLHCAEFKLERKTEVGLDSFLSWDPRLGEMLQKRQNPILELKFSTDHTMNSE